MIWLQLNRTSGDEYVTSHDHNEFYKKCLGFPMVKKIRKQTGVLKIIAFNASSG